MKEKLVREVQHGMLGVLDQRQQEMLKSVLLRCLEGYAVKEEQIKKESSNSVRFLDMFISAKRVEGCSDKTIEYYSATIKKLFESRIEMLFNSITFIIFFAITLFLYYVLPFKIRWIMLLFASCIFYMWWRPEFIILILIMLYYNTYEFTKIILFCLKYYYT